MLHREKSGIILQKVNPREIPVLFYLPKKIKPQITLVTIVRILFSQFLKV